VTPPCRSPGFLRLLAPLPAPPPAAQERIAGRPMGPSDVRVFGFQMLRALAHLDGPAAGGGGSGGRWRPSASLALPALVRLSLCARPRLPAALAGPRSPPPSLPAAPSARVPVGSALAGAGSPHPDRAR